MKIIHWLVSYNKPTPEIIKNSNLASIRMRLSSILNQENYAVTFGNEILNNPDCIVIGKLIKDVNNSRENLWLHQIIEKKKNGSKIILDYTDNHLGFDSPLSSFYNKILFYTDTVTTSSNYLANELKKIVKVPIEVIPDALEIKPIRPSLKKNNETNILWFGHYTNIKFLLQFIENWSYTKNRFKLHILTNKMLDLTKFYLPSNLTIEVRTWSIDEMIHTAKICDLAIIPSDPNDAQKAGVSSNRLITALALGLPTAADIMSSYKEFNEFFVDIRSKEFLNLLNNSDDFHSQVIKAQKEIVPHFFQDVICQKWMNLFSKLKSFNL